jgi:hypothetical protein
MNVRDEIMERKSQTSNLTHSPLLNPSSSSEKAIESLVYTVSKYPFFVCFTLGCCFLFSISKFFHDFKKSIDFLYQNVLLRVTVLYDAADSKFLYRTLGLAVIW